MYKMSQKRIHFDNGENSRNDSVNLECILSLVYCRTYNTVVLAEEVLLVYCRTYNTMVLAYNRLPVLAEEVLLVYCRTYNTMVLAEDLFTDIRDCDHIMSGKRASCLSVPPIAE